MARTPLSSIMASTLFLPKEIFQIHLAESPNEHKWVWSFCRGKKTLRRSLIGQVGRWCGTSRFISKLKYLFENISRTNWPPLCIFLKFFTHKLTLTIFSSDHSIFSLNVNWLLSYEILLNIIWKLISQTLVIGILDLGFLNPSWSWLFESLFFASIDSSSLLRKNIAITLWNLCLNRIDWYFCNHSAKAPILWKRWSHLVMILSDLVQNKRLSLPIPQPYSITSSTTNQWINFNFLITCDGSFNPPLVCAGFGFTIEDK